MKKITMAVFLIAAMAFAPTAFGNGLNLNGLGTRAVTMGGAFVGLADDFSALYWNPAGLGFIEKPTLGFNLLDVMPSASYRFSLVGGDQVAADSPTKHYLGGLGGWIQPIDDHLVAGIGIFTPSGLGSAWNPQDMASLSGGNRSIDWSSRIGVFTIAPTIAYKVNDSLSLGAQLNISYGFFNLNTYAGYIYLSSGTVIDLGQYEETLSGWGFGATLGVLYKPSDKISLGLTYRTAATIKFSGKANIFMFEYLGYSKESEIERPVTWPSWLAAGVAVKPTDRLTITADVQFTNWKKLDVLETTYQDPFWSLLMTAAGNTERELYWENKLQLRVGAEYVFCRDWAVRAGFYNDPSPAPDRTMNILLPSFGYSGLTLGFGRMAGNLQIDFGLELLLGRERTIAATAANAAAMPGVYGMTIVVPHFSVSHRF
ncbi:MAG: outer membrane protein transport protein [Candidatus Aminicenantes bacterium]|nr:outer membrane protein transport protein [Candidatus Aminicenantes bacterium]